MSRRGFAFGDGRMLMGVPGDDVKRVRRVHKGSRDCATQALTLIHTGQYSVLGPQMILNENKPIVVSPVSRRMEALRCASMRLLAIPSASGLVDAGPRQDPKPATTVLTQARVGLGD